MSKAIGILMVVAMFALSGCATSGGDFGARDVSKANLANPSVAVVADTTPSGYPAKGYPPYHW